MEYEAKVPVRGPFPTRYLLFYLALGVACLAAPYLI